MSDYVDSAAVGGAEDIPDLTTAAVTTTGTNKVFIGASAAGGFGGSVDTTAMRYGGAGGTLLTQIGSDQAVGGLALLLLSAWQKENPAASSQTGYAAFASATTQASAIVGACYEGVDQATPVGTPQTNTGSDGTGTLTSISCTVTATGLTIGRRLVAVVAAFTTGVDATGFTATSGQGTLRDSAISTLAIAGVALVDKVIAATSEAIGATFNISAAGAQMDYAIIAFELIDAGGGGGGDVLLGQALM